MPWHLFCRGRSPLPPAGLSATEAEWKLFQHLRRSAGGLSGLLLFQFCLTLYVVLWGGTRTVVTGVHQKMQQNHQQNHHHQNSSRTSPQSITAASNSTSSAPPFDSALIYCPWLVPWMVTYTAALFLFRAAHEIAMLWWREGASRGRKTNGQRQPQRSSDDWRLYTGARLYMWTHAVALPATSSLVGLGFILLPFTPPACAPRDVYTLQYIFLALAVPVLCIKGMLHYQYIKRDIFLFLARTDTERFVSHALSPQFLSDAGDATELGQGRIAVSSAWTMTFPITASVGPPSKCVICLEDVLAGDKIRDFPCRHHFHVCCIDRWLRDHDTCPSCKDVVKRSTPLEDFHQRAREEGRMRRAASSGTRAAAAGGGVGVETGDIRVEVVR